MENLLLRLVQVHNLTVRRWVLVARKVFKFPNCKKMTEVRINFLELVRQFEAAIQTDFNFELLEMYYRPYSFGSGMAAYRIKSKGVKIIYDGKEFIANLYVSVGRIQYARSADRSADWIEVFSGISSDLLTSGIRDLKNHLL